jgi:hypothetical protein
MMDLPVEAWNRAISVRTSRRSFEARLPEEETLALLEKNRPALHSEPGNVYNEALTIGE